MRAKLPKMEQHPVPQQISAYEFRLVGDMTLKQFGYLAGGVVVALVFYSIPMFGFFKWFLVLLSAFTGFALAFLPIEERPLTTWIIAFFKSVFSPTMYIWRKKPQPPEIFKTKIVPKIVPIKTVLPTNRSKMTAYLETLPVAQAPLEKKERTNLAQINQLFQTLPVPTLMPTPASMPTPMPIPRPRTRPISTPPPRPRVIPDFKPVRKPLPVKPVRLPEKPGHRRQPAVTAKTTTELPIPSPPTQPNILVGMTLDKEGQMIEGAILEIRNSSGMPVRALRTNKLGQFRIATPLSDDTYEIETEKEGLLFDIIKIEAKGRIIKPIEIRAK